MFKVYKYTFPNEKIYIGVTKNSIQYRKDCGYQHNKPLQDAIRGFGWLNVKVDILAEVESRNDAFSLEEKFINELNATNPNVGYNVSKGGKSTFAGLHHSAEHREKMSRLYKGRKFSDETLCHIKAAHAKERKAVACYTLDGEQVSCFESLHEAAKAFNGHPSNISRACKKEAKTYKGYVWFFV